MLGTKILEERESKFNGHLRVVKTLGMGTYIQADGLTQSGGIVETIWKSTLSKIRSSKSEIRDVLILGLGGGTVVKLVCKLWPDAKITGVDIDPVMIALGKKYLDLDPKRIDIKTQDADTTSQELIANGEKFDLVIIDLYNGDKFPEKFTTGNYIHLVRSGLARSGVAVFNRLYYKDKKREAGEFGENLKKVFKSVEYFYPGINLMFICKI